MASEAPHRSFAVTDRSHLALIKKEIHQMAVEAGFSVTQTGKIDIIVAELGSNFIKHAGDGELLVRTTSGCMNIIGIDSGAGMAEPARMMEDGTTTSNTLGGGLGAIKRLSDHFQIYSQKGWGTIIFSEVRSKAGTAAKPREFFQRYSLLVPYPGEYVCGDGFVQKTISGNTCIFLGDGLGHGPAAHEAVQTAITFLAGSTDAAPVTLLRSMSEVVKKTRGLVGTVAVYNPKQKSWAICGIGNIATRTVQGIGGKAYMAYNGIIGHTLPRTLNEQQLELTRGGYLVLCSDGIRTRWEISKYPNIHRCDPCILAAALYKDFARRTDDAAVVVIRML